MANYYTHFSIVLELPLPALDWAITVRDAFSEGADERPPIIPQKLWDKLEGETLDLQIEQQRGSLWIAAEDGGGNTHHACQFILAIVQEWKLQPVGFEWSNTCDRPREDGFSGGAAFITKDGIEVMTTSEWLEQHLNSAAPVVGV